MCHVSQEVTLECFSWNPFATRRGVINRVTQWGYIQAIVAPPLSLLTTFNPSQSYRSALHQPAITISPLPAAFRGSRWKREGGRLTGSPIGQPLHRFGSTSRSDPISNVIHYLLIDSGLQESGSRVLLHLCSPDRCPFSTGHSKPIQLGRSPGVRGRKGYQFAPTNDRG